MPNPTIGNESQFTPSYSWGNGYSSFDIATEQETLISGKNPTLNAKRIRKNIAYDFSGKQTSNEIELVSQFQSYGRKFISTTETDVAIIEKTEYSGNAYTPAGINAYLTNINTTVNPSNMAGTQNSNLQNNNNDSDTENNVKQVKEVKKIKINDGNEDDPLLMILSNNNGSLTLDNLKENLSELEIKSSLKIILKFQGLTAVRLLGLDHPFTELGGMQVLGDHASYLYHIIILPELEIKTTIIFIK